jgi:hypothetical protein
VSVIKTNQLMLYREVIAGCAEIRTKHMNALCGQNVEIVNVKPSGTYSDHRALKVLVSLIQGFRAEFGFKAWEFDAQEANWPPFCTVSIDVTEFCDEISVTDGHASLAKVFPSCTFFKFHMNASQSRAIPSGMFIPHRQLLWSAAYKGLF